MKKVGAIMTDMEKENAGLRETCRKYKHDYHQLKSAVDTFLINAIGACEVKMEYAKSWADRNMKLPASVYEIQLKNLHAELTEIQEEFNENLQK